MCYNYSMSTPDSNIMYRHCRRYVVSLIATLAAVAMLAGVGNLLSAPNASAATVAPATGYWLVASDGGIFSFGGAQFYGSTGGQTISGSIVGAISTPNGDGYWEATNTGIVFPFGDAPFYGDLNGDTLNKPIVGIASTPDGGGYWLVASDGGIFSFGDAQFYGSMGGKPLNKPIVGMAAVPGGGGYWEVASDGGIFSFGDAQFYGSTGGMVLNKPVIGMAITTATAASPGTSAYQPPTAAPSFWTSEPYTSAYTASIYPQSPGNPLDVTVPNAGSAALDGITWNSSEFDDALGEVPPGATADTHITVPLFAQPASTTSLSWAAPPSGDFFIVTSTGADAFPNFSSPQSVIWPSSASWNPSWGWWSTEADQVGLVIPASAPMGATYELQVQTCSLSSGTCSGNPGTDGPQGGVADVTVAVGTAAEAAYNTPFAFYSGYAPSTNSELGESITATTNHVWFTQGGASDLTQSPVPNNYSRIVGYDPAAESFCNYIVPESDTEVTGIAAADGDIWFLASRGLGGSSTAGPSPAVGYFNPSAVGGCSPGDTQSITLTACNPVLPDTAVAAPSPAGCNLNYLEPWSDQMVFPGHLVVDTAGNTATIWATEFWGSAITKLQVSDVTTGAYTSLVMHLASTNPDSFFGAEPWQIVQDANYVYAVDYGDNNIVRINKTTNQVDEVQVPLTDSSEQLHSDAIYNGNLYFTLSNGSTTGGTTAIGYIGIAFWEAASAACANGTNCAPLPTVGVVYSGLAAAVGSAGSPGISTFSGIGIASDGAISLAGMHGIVILRPIA